MKIEGKNSVIEAIKSGKTFSKVLISNRLNDEIVDLVKKSNIKYQFVDKSILDKNSETKNHQGIIGFVEDFAFCTVEEILNVSKTKNKPNFILILDGIEDPHNFGSIIRVCECLGIDGIIIGKNRACNVTDTVVKTSAGAINYVKIAKVTNINNTIEELKKKNVWVYACELGGENLTQAKFSGNTAIVLGGEGNGVSKLTLKLVDGIVTIPMFGKVNSLNVSVATGIVLNEVRNKLFND